ncbi:hypothetical protein Emag_005718 [Eimeria magna]
MIGDSESSSFCKILGQSIPLTQSLVLPISAGALFMLRTCANESRPLDELCLELGAWSPSDPSPGGARYSPLLVDAFFTSLDQSIAQPPAQTSTPGAAPTPRELLLAQPEAGEKRPLDEEEFDNEAGTSGKVARTHAQAGAVQASSSQLVHFGSLEPEASSQPSPEQLTLADPLSFQPSSSSAVSHLMQTAPAHQPAEPASASSEVVFFLSVGPAAGLPPPQRPEADLGPRHPFVRLPRLKPGVKTRQFMTSAMRSANLAPRRHCDTLLRLRRLFRLSRLSEREAGSLVSCAEELAAHAYHSLQDKPQDTSPFFASIRLGRKFLIVYYLLRASQVLGQKWPSESWWGELMERIPHQYFFVWARDPRASAFSVSLANDLSHAISLMKSGVFPPPSVIIQLKRRLFCMSESPGKLKEKVWDPWRQDDEEAQTSRESLKPH